MRTAMLLTLVKHKGAHFVMSMYKTSHLSRLDLTHTLRQHLSLHCVPPFVIFHPLRFRNERFKADDITFAMDLYNALVEVDKVCPFTGHLQELY